MKQLLLTILLHGLIICCAAQSQSTFHADHDTAAENEIARLEFFLNDLLMNGDIDVYAGWLTDDYVRIAANGTVSTKEQALEGFRKSKIQSKNTPHDLVVRIYGNTAILRALLDIETTTGGVVTKRTSIITKIFIKRNGKWYLASLQGTSLPQ